MATTDKGGGKLGYLYDIFLIAVTEDKLETLSQ